MYVDSLIEYIGPPNCVHYECGSVKSNLKIKVKSLLDMCHYGVCSLIRI